MQVIRERPWEGLPRVILSCDIQGRCKIGLTEYGKSLFKSSLSEPPQTDQPGSSQADRSGSVSCSEKAQASQVCLSTSQANLASFLLMMTFKNHFSRRTFTCLCYFPKPNKNKQQQNTTQPFVATSCTPLLSTFALGLSESP